MTAVLAIVGVQLAVAALLFGTLLLDRPAGAADHDHPTLRYLRRRPR